MHVGLGSVDNTSDADKPVSAAQAAALALKANVSGAAFTGPVLVAPTSPSTAASDGTAGANAMMSGQSGGATTGTSSNVAGRGADLTLRSGNGGAAPAGSTNGVSGDVVLIANGAGGGTGTGVPGGKVVLRTAKNRVDGVVIQRSAQSVVAQFDTSNSRLGIGKTPSSALDVAGTTSSDLFKMTTGAALNSVIASDAGGTFSWRTSLPNSRPLNNVKDFGAVGDGLQLTDAVMTASSAVLTSASASFSAGDVGKIIFVDDAGLLNASTSKTALSTTILSVTSATQMTLATPAVNSVTGGRASYGTNDLASIRNAIISAGRNGVLYFPKSTYMFNGRLTPLFGQEWFGDGEGSSVLRGAATNDYAICINGTSEIFRFFFLHDVTQDTANLYRASGLQIYSASSCRVERVSFLNVRGGGWLAKVGVQAGATDEFRCRDVTMTDCTFDGHVGSLEMLLVFNTMNCRIIRPTFRNKTQTGPVLGLWQKTTNTIIEDLTMEDCLGFGIYYSFTCEETYIVRP